MPDVIMNTQITEWLIITDCQNQIMIEWLTCQTAMASQWTGEVPRKNEQCQAISSLVSTSSSYIQSLFLSSFFGNENNVMLGVSKTLDPTSK